MKEGSRMKGWSRIAFAVLLAVSLALPAAVLLTMSLPAPALANEELHPGSRLFFPYWDVTGTRVTFLILTRLPLFPVDQFQTSTYNTLNNCKPGHTAAFPNPTGGTNLTADDVHLEWYGKGCKKRNNLIHMSCADVDLIFLSASNYLTLTEGTDTVGALDAHFIINNTNEPKNRVHDNSLMGNAVVADSSAGWAAMYPAAAAKSTQCTFCSDLDNGTDVGYEPYPLELFLPFALVDDSQGAGTLSNTLALWAPTFFPGGDMEGLSFGVQWDWYDGRERRFIGSQGGHSFIKALKSLDVGFSTANTPQTWTCGHSAVGGTGGGPAGTTGIAENDGFARDGTNPIACGSTSAGDATHPSDERDNQTSTPIGWWNFNKSSDTAGPFVPYNGFSQATRGMVGVVLAATAEGVGTTKQSNGDFIRLWHKDPCETGPRGTIGPPHLRDRAFRSNNNYLVTFNIFSTTQQRSMCNREAISTPSGGFPPFETSAP